MTAERPSPTLTAGSLTPYLRSLGIEFDSLRVTYGRREGERRQLIGMELRRGSQAVPLHLKLYGDEERADEVFAKWQTLRVRPGPLGIGVIRLPDRAGLLLSLPNDAGLRRLPEALDLHKLKRRLARTEIAKGRRIRGSRSSIEILRYKPEHRLVARLDLAMKDDASGKRSRQQLILRAYADDRGRRNAALARHLRAAGLSDAVAEPIAESSDGQLQFETMLPGKPPFRGDHDPGQMAAALSLLDRFRKIRGAPVGHRSTEEFLDQRRREFQTVQDLVPADLRREILDLLSRDLPDASRGAPALLHGDLHSDQFLLTENAVGLVDFERCTYGDPVLDDGHFLAELEIRALEKPEDAEAAKSWQKAIRDRAGLAAGDPSLEARRLDWSRGLGMIAGVARAYRRRELGIPTVDPQVLAERAIENLKRLPSRPRVRSTTAVWEVLYPGGRDPWPALGRRRIDGPLEYGAFDRRSRTFELRRPEEDPELSGLKDALREGELVSWRYGRRAVVRRIEENGPATYWKILSKRRFGRRLDPLRDLSREPLARTASVKLALITEEEPSWCALRTRTISGEPLSQRMKTSRAERNELVTRTAQAILQLHTLPRPGSLVALAPDDLETWRSLAEEFFPGCAEDMQEAFHRLPSPGGDDRVLLHGDLHDNNILDDGTTIGFIDLDGIGAGPAARDLGNLAAHLDLAELRKDPGPNHDDDEGRGLHRAYCAAGGSCSEEDFEAERIRSFFRVLCVRLFRGDPVPMLRRGFRRIAALKLMLGLIFLSACVGLTDDRETSLEPESGDAKTRLGTGYLNKKDTVELKGRFEGDEFRVSNIEIEEPDDELEIKAEIREVQVEAGVILVGGKAFTVVPESSFFDEEGNSLRLPDLAGLEGTFCKAEGIERDRQFELRKLSLRRRKSGESDELQGTLDSISRRKGRMTVGGIDVSFEEDVPVFWDVEDEDPPPLEQRGLRPRSDPRLKKILRIDDEDLRSGAGTKLADFLTLGGEVQWDLEWRKNHNLRGDRKRDRLLHEASAKVELSFDIDPKVFAFVQGRFGHEFVVFDEDRDFDFDPEVSLDQAYVLLMDLPLRGLAVELGRQKFDHGREWVMDDDIDGARIFLNTEHALFEVSVSHSLFDESPEEEGVTNYLFGIHLEPFDDSDFFVYALHRRGGDLVDLDRWHFGLSFEKEIDDFTLWGDIGYVRGKEDDLDVEGYGVDVHAMYVFSDTPWELSFYGGFAYGSGDGDRTDGKDSSFRQTGLQDNNDRFNGVTSFRYLGELVRPEVSNLVVLTAGFGVRPHRRTSIDVVVHRYWQVEPSTFLRDSRLRLNPEGLQEDLGFEVDLIVGLEAWQPIEVEIVMGYFQPGQAFGVSPDDAWFLTFQIEWNF